MQFNFDVERDSSGRNKKERIIRLAVLFLAVTAVTATVIYLLIPKSSGNEGENDAAEAISQAASIPDQPGEEKSDGVKKDEPKADEKVEKSAADAANKSADVKKESGKKVRRTSLGIKYTPSSKELMTNTRVLAQMLENGSWVNKFGTSYEIKSNDRVENLAKKFHSTSEFIVESNKLQLKNGNPIIVPGKEIALLRADGWQITISRSQGTLQVDRKVENELIPFAAFKCRVAPAGEVDSNLVVCTRNLKLKYKGEYGVEYEHGNAVNPYGDFQITLANADRPGKALLPLTIHAASQSQEAVEKSIKDGATVMTDEDIRILYMIIPVGTPVKIVE